MPLSLETLPNEIKYYVLEHISDFDSLRAFVLVSRVFHHVYVENRQKLLAAVMDNFIHPALHADAYVAVRLRLSSRAVHPRQSLIDSVLRWRTLGLEEPLRPVTYTEEFKTLVQFQQTVNYLTNDLCESIFEHARSMKWTSNAQTNPRQAEVVRIQRALYRIEIWNQVGAKNGDHGMYLHDARNELLLQFPPWELDEMGCVYDYLMRRVASIIEALGEAHLGSEEEYYRLLTAGDTMPSRGIAHWVEPSFQHGLAKINALIQATKEPQPSEMRNLKIQRLSSELTYVTHHAFELSKALTSKPDAEFAPSPTIPSNAGIAGPNDAWLWAHQGPNDKLDWYQTWKADLGEWCASIWDRQRLREWGRLQGEWSIDHYRSWAPKKQAQNVLDRQRRMAQDPQKPTRIPCTHGLNTDDVPQAKGLLYYRGRTETENHEFSSCPLCFDEIQATERATGRPQVKVVRYGGQR